MDNKIMNCMFANRKRISIRLGFISSVLVMLMLWGCQPAENQEQMNNKQIKIDEYTYTVGQVRKHLLTMFYVEDERMRLALWLPEAGEIKYSLIISKDLDVAHIRKVFAERMDYFKELTGTNFIEVVEEGQSGSVLFTITSSLSMIKDLEFVRELSGADEMNNEEYSQRFQNFDKNKNQITRFTAGWLDINGEYSIFNAYSAQKWSSKEFDKDVQIESIIVDQIYSVLLPLQVLSKQIQTSNAKGIYKQPPYLWPFDDALLKVMYSNYQLSGMPVAEGVEVIIEKLLEEYGV